VRRLFRISLRLQAGSDALAFDDDGALAALAAGGPGFGFVAEPVEERLDAEAAFFEFGTRKAGGDVDFGTDDGAGAGAGTGNGEAVPAASAPWTVEAHAERDDGHAELRGEVDGALGELAARAARAVGGDR